jgi:glyoxylase-like metal-dependent hydrolase (beta-lactamase superfamily II)
MDINLPPEPIVNVSKINEIASGLFVIPDLGIPLVPNIGIVVGREAVLVIDTGMGPINGSNVLETVEKISKGKKLFVTTTHFHPEHSFGLSAFASHATIIMNKTQQHELAEKGIGYLEFFKTFGSTIASQLESVEFINPDIIYDSTYSLDLGGRNVIMQATGQAHTLGDQIVRVPDCSAIFCGDLVEESQFSIFPWFPPSDIDVSGVKWLGVMEQLLKADDRLVVPGHGQVSDKSLLVDVYDYLSFLKREVWSRSKSGMHEEQIILEISKIALLEHPKWVGQEWIEKGISCFCSEYKPELE